MLTTHQSFSKAQLYIYRSFIVVLTDIIDLLDVLATTLIIKIYSSNFTATP